MHTAAPELPECPLIYGFGHNLLTAEFGQQEDTERAKEWKQVLDSTIAALQHQLRLHPQTGLLADFLVYDHSERCYKPCEGKILEKDNDGEYNWNSCRCTAALLLPSSVQLFELIELGLHALFCVFCCGYLKECDANGIHVCGSRVL